ncbi:MAG TPA: amino acid adenylation domain-containing protein [Actinocatenispora sp.]
MSMFTSAETLVELLRERADQTPDDLAYAELDGSGETRRTVTYAELDVAARTVAAGLGARHRPGDRIVLVLSGHVDFLVAFLGTLYAGMVPVPAAPPAGASAAQRMATQVADCAPAAVLADDATLGTVRAAVGPVAAPLADLGTGEPADRPAAVVPSDLAFLQYTSGSTARPKGVMVSHRNVLANEALIARRFGNGRDTVVCSWLPNFHDMGLIGGLLQPLYLGRPAYLLTPRQFLARPDAWLRAVSRYRATTSGGPNFAYELCVRRVSEEAARELDLSSWRVAFTGAEPIRPDTLRRFGDRFGAAGFPRRSFLPCYGLAEATLYVAGAEPGRGLVTGTFSARGLATGAAVPPVDEADRSVLPSSGRTDETVPVVVVDPNGDEELPPDRIGEICVGGDGVAAGYWERPEASAETFGRTVGGRTLLRTGDLGFVRAGELYVTGRAKDLIIVRGRNVYPQDLESAAATADLPLRPDAIVAASRPDPAGTEVLLLAEVHGSARPGAAEAGLLRAHLVETTGVLVHTVVFLRPGGIPRTTSGKVQRAAAAARFTAGELPVRYAGSVPVDDAAGDPAESDDPVALVARALGTDVAAVPLDVPLVALGLDSVRAAQLALALERLGARVPVPELLTACTLRQLLERCDEAPGPAKPGTAAVDVPEDAPASLTQEAFAVLAERLPDGAESTLFSLVEPLPALPVDACRAAFETIVRRHPVLRSAIVHTADGWRQRQVAAASGFRRRRFDSVDAVLAYAAEQAGTAIPLGRAPLARLDCVDGPDGRQFLLFLAHHAVLDFWSLTRFWTEFRHLVGGGDPAELPPVSAAQAEQAVAQRELRDSPLGEAVRASWRDALREPRFLPLPAPARAGEGCGTVPVALDRAAYDRVRAVAAAAGVTPFVVLLAAFQRLLSVVTGEREIRVAVPFHGRTRAGWEHAIGCFVNTLPVTAAVEPDTTFLDLLGQVRDRLAEAMAVQDQPLVALGVRMPWRGAVTPLTQVGFVVHSSADPAMQELAPLAVPGFAGEVGAGPYRLRTHPLPRRDLDTELRLSLTETADGMTGAVEYDRGRVAAGWADQLPALFAATLDGLLSRPGVPLSALDPADRDGRDAARRTGVGVRRPAGADAVRHLLSVAAGTPDAVAVEHGRDRVTYAGLVARVAAARSVLASFGVGAGQVVGVHLAPSADRAAWVYAIWAHGAVYLPLDVTAPGDRLAAMVEAAECAWVVAPEPFPGARHVPADLRARPDAPVGGVAADPEAPAYLLFTSGSTGRPKGVLVPHRGVANVLAAQRALFGLEPGDRVLAFAAVSFDAAVFELLLAHGAGATLVIPLPAERTVGNLGRTLRRRAVTAAVLAASVVRRIPADVAYPQLTTLVVAGERMPPSVVADWAGRCRLYNAYGPTEATIWSSTALVGDGDTPVIGRPVDNVDLFVVDDELRLLAPGCIGEILIGGAGVALGYANEPELTARAFVDVPELGGRCYRSGDLGRWREDGALEFLGRRDRQVKIRGVRIELAEVERQILDDPAVADAAVVAVGGSDARLVAFAVFHPDVPGQQELRTRLGSSLPAAMIPDRIVALPALPVDRHGKVDVRALRDEAAATGGADRLVVSFTDEERAVAAILESELGQPVPDPLTDLFLLGASSLNVTRIAARLAERFGRRLSVAEFYGESTVRALTARLFAEPAAAAVEAVAAVPSADLSAVQRDILLADRLTSGPSAYHIPLLLRLSRRVDAEALAAAVAAVSARHPNLRARLRAGTGTLPTVEYGDEPVAVDVVDVSAEPDPAAAALARHRAALARPFDLAAEAPLRVTLLDTGSGQALSLVGHHVFLDGWSMRVVLADLSAAYAAGEAWAPAPPAGGASASDPDAAREYWAGVLAGAPGRLRLGTGRPGASGARMIRHEVTDDVLDGLRAFARDERVSVFAVGMGAFLCLLAHRSGAGDLATGTVFAGRDDHNQDHVGFVATTVPVRVPLTVSMTFRDVVRAVWGQLRLADRYRGLSLSDIAAAAGIGSVAQSGLLQTLFVQAESEFWQVRLGDAEGELVDAGPAAAKSELTVFFPADSATRTLAVEYDAARFGDAETEALLAHYVALLVAFTADPDLGVRHLSAGPDGDRRLGSVPSPDASGVPAPWLPAGDPDDPVLAGPHTTLTRAQLDAAVDAVATGLVDAGVRRGDRVGVDLPDPVHAAVATLAVWRAGAAVDLSDPLPGRRIGADAADPLGYPLLAATPARPGELTVPGPDTIGCWVGDAGAARGYRYADLAWRARWLGTLVPLGAGAVVAGTSGPGTPPGLLFELLWPLTAGAGVRFLGAAEDPPAHVAAVHAEPRRLSELAVPAGTRVVCAELVPGWLAARLPDVTIEQCWGTDGLPVAHRTVPATGGRMLAGRPVVPVEILGDLRQPLPTSVTGSVHLAETAGPAVTEGAGDTVRGGLWRTGLLGRWTDAGELDVRGDAAVAERLGGPPEDVADAVRDCADVLAVAVFPATPPVVALVPAPGTAPVPAQLLDRMTGLLPPWLVPGRVLVSHEVPAQAPPPPSAAGGDDQQERLREIWQRVLGVDEVGSDVNFFDAGGRSMLVLDLQREVRREFGREVPVALFFQYTTIAEFSRQVLAGLAESPSAAPTRPDLARLRDLRARLDG